MTPDQCAARGRPLAETVTTIPSFEQIYAERFHDVSRWVRALGGMDADLDDLTQEVFMVVRRKLAKFDGKNLSGWLYAIAKNQVNDYRRRAWYRRLWRRPATEPEVRSPRPETDAGADPCEALQQREMQTFLNQTMAKMSAAQRAAFILFEIEGYSGEEIAELERIPINTVWTRLHHARRQFFQLIDSARAEGRLP